MLICAKCGTENPLGRVFCGGCGKKLETSHVSSQDLTGSEADNWFIANIKYFVAAAIIAILVMVGMALWPSAGVVGDVGSRLHGLRVERQLAGMKRVGSNMTVGPFTFVERDINGYLDMKKDTWKIDAMSVDIKDDVFMVRIATTLFSIPLGSMKVAPKVTYEMACSAFGDGIGIRSSKIGHLPLGGPFKRTPLKILYKIVSSDKNWAVFSNVDEIKVTEGKITVIIKK